MPKLKPIKYKRYELHVVWDHNLIICRDFAVSITEIIAHVQQLGAPFVNWSYYNSSDRRFPLPSDMDELCRKVLTPSYGNIRGIKPNEILHEGCSALLFSEGGGGGNSCLDINLGQTHGGCSLTFPSKGEIATQTLTTERIQQALKALVIARNPKWAVVDYWGVEGGQSTTDIPVCWLIYTADNWRPMPLFLEPFEVHRIESYGNYVITTPEPFDCDREDHREAANSLKTMLIDANVLLRA
jgi:Immunity protein 52